MNTNTLKYPNFRFPVPVISYATYLYNRYTLSYRDVAYLLHEHSRLQRKDSVLEAIVVAVAPKLTFTKLSAITMSSLRESGSFATNSATDYCVQRLPRLLGATLIAVSTNLAVQEFAALTATTQFL
jgi:hypothetical protein